MVSRLPNLHIVDLGSITLVATGPLTNLALAARLDHEFPQLLESVVIMGGNIYGKGNTTPSAEFNFHVDPEAAYIVLSDFNTSIYIVSWELTLEQAVDMNWFKSLLNVKTKRGEFMKSIHDHSLVKLASPETASCSGVKDWIPCDPAAMAVALDKSVLKTYKTCPCTVELTGTVTRGQMMVDWNSLSGQSKTIHVVTDLHNEKLKELMLAGVQ
ncbi:inosine-uridine preferring nucleoside hydrolase-like [Amphiura filiformis]|uniref:inosine-uridine preferring nucleoside hydrolase-like n=1 Tax=Amphiura filiformis TaxID=82378 RepID=UPI003B2204D8